jgi:ABC-type phosphate transport system substrate-binding protein
MRRVLLTIAAVLAAAPLAAEEKPAYRVIVNPANPATELDRKLVADAFLKKVSRWPNNELIRPVDLGSDDAVRERFTAEVLGRSVSAIKNYWQQLIFSGRGVPPPEVDSDDAVVKYVLKHKAAIGYVSPGADVGEARAVTVR